MLHFKNIKTLTNISATATDGAWPVSPICHGVPVKSSGQRPLHVYATTAGLVIFAPERQVGILWPDLLKFAESVAPELCKVPEIPAPKVVQPEKDFHPNTKAEVKA